MTATVVKFQMLLRELFQFDYADLDFGIYCCGWHHTHHRGGYIPKAEERGTVAGANECVPRRNSDPIGRIPTLPKSSHNEGILP